MEPSVKRAHDDLLAGMPPGARHHDCPFCDAGDIAHSKEVAGVDERTYSQKEHEAILTDAVRREVASATEQKESELSELQQKVDVLESEKAALEQGKADAEKALEDYKNEQERAREVAERKDARVTAIKEVTAHELPESYFTKERVTRWAEMAEEDFEALVDSQAEASVTALTSEEAKELAGLEGEARRAKLVEVIGKRKESARDEGKPAERETAAFSGGVVPSSRENAGEGAQPTNLSTWLNRRAAGA